MDLSGLDLKQLQGLSYHVNIQLIRLQRGDKSSYTQLHIISPVEETSCSTPFMTALVPMSDIGP